MHLMFDYTYVHIYIYIYSYMYTHIYIYIHQINDEDVQGKRALLSRASIVILKTTPFL